MHVHHCIGDVALTDIGRETNHFHDFSVYSTLTVHNSFVDDLIFFGL